MTAAAPSACAIGLDVGGTKIAAGVAGFPDGRPLERRTIPTRPERGGRAVLDDVLQVARELAGGEGFPGRRVEVVGLGVCELVDCEGRLASANCIQWLDLPVREELTSIAPAFLEADVRAAALAEALFGAGRNLRNFLYVTVGTGISCCLMVEGEPYLGARGATGTMASSPLSVPCARCGATHLATLEEIASGPALVSRFNAAAGGAAIHGQEVLAAAASGDRVALEVVHSAAEALGSQIGLLINTLDPGAVVIGGGLGLSSGLYWERLVAATQRHVWSATSRDLPIRQAGTGEDAGWLGAAAAAWRAGRRGLPGDRVTG